MSVVTSAFAGAAAPAGPTSSLPDVTTPAQPAGAPTMRDLQARFTLDSADPLSLGRDMRALFEARGGTIVKDEITRNRGFEELTIEARVPLDRADAVVRLLSDHSDVVARQVTVTDITKQFTDSQLLLRNLEAQIKRYAELLDLAKDVKEILAIEDQLSRLRAQIDQTKADLAWLKDRAARATFAILIRNTQRTELPNSTTLMPTIHGGALWDIRGRQGGVNGAGYAGGGASVRVLALASRGFVVQFGAYGSSFGANPTAGRSAWIATAGPDMYSSYFGNGQKRFLNPYFGLRIGYAHVARAADIPFGVVVGLDLFKGARINWDVACEAMMLPVAEAGVVSARMGLGAAF